MFMIEATYLFLVLMSSFLAILFLGIVNIGDTRSKSLIRKNILVVVYLLVLVAIYLTLPIFAFSDQEYYHSALDVFLVSGHLDEYIADKEVGFSILAKFLVLTLNDARGALAALSGLTISLFIYGNIRLSRSISWGTLAGISTCVIWFYLWSVDGIRQAVAISFFVISVSFLVEKKIVYSILFVIIGSLFHLSILYSIPVLFLLVWMIKFEVKVRAVYLYILLFLSLAITAIPEVAQNFLNIVTYSFDVLFGREYSHYLSKSASIVREEHSGLGLGLLHRALIFIYVIHTIKNNYEYKHIPHALFSCLLIFNFVLVMFGSVEILTRALLYFYSFVGFLLVESIRYSLRNENKLMVYTGLSLVFSSPLIFYVELSRGFG